MRKTLRRIGLLLLLAELQTAAAAPPPEEACVISADQVSTAVRAKVADGAYMGTFKRTCTWKALNAPPKSVKFVTLQLQNVEAFQSGKELMSARMVVTPVSDIGDDAYFLAVGEQVGLIVRRGEAAFKITVYADLPVETKKAMENGLARMVVEKF